MSIIQRTGLQCGVVKLLSYEVLYGLCDLRWQLHVAEFNGLNMCIDLLSQGWVCSVSAVKLLRVTKLTVSVLSGVD